VSSDLLQSKVALCSDYSQDNASRLSHVRENKRFNKLEVLFRLVFVSGHVEAGQIDHSKMRLGRSRDFHPKDRVPVRVASHYTTRATRTKTSARKIEAVEPHTNCIIV
jgi:hypothetical protein